MRPFLALLHKEWRDARNISWKQNDAPRVAALQDGSVAVARRKTVDIVAPDGTQRRVLGAGD